MDAPNDDDRYIENRTFDEIQVGDEAHLEKRLTLDDIKLFAIMSGDVNPSHVDDDFARSSSFQEIIAHGMWGGALISTVLGTQLPGPGTLYLGQTLTFRKPVSLGDVLKVSVRVAAKDDARSQVTLDCRCENQKGDVVIEGEARVLAPKEKIRRPRTVMPSVRMAERGRLHEILSAADHPPAICVAVVHPVDDVSLTGAVAAAEHGLITPLLIGPKAKIQAAAEDAELDISEDRLDERRQRRLRDDSDRDARRRDPDLTARQIHLEVFSHRPRPSQPRLVERRLRILPNTGQRELDRDKKAVGEDERDAGEQSNSDLERVHARKMFHTG